MKLPHSFLQEIIDGFSIDDALEIKEIEKVTNHDVKAVEYFLKQRCKYHPEIAKVKTHFTLVVFRCRIHIFIKILAVLNVE